MVKITKTIIGKTILALSVFISIVAAQSSPTDSTTPVFNLPTSSASSASPTASAKPTPTAGAMTCPGPTIPDKLGLGAKGLKTCQNGCCLKCPVVESFYEPNEVQNVMKTAYVIRQFSLVAAFFMAISYMVLPGKRSQPHISVLFLTVSVSLWFIAFDVMPGVSNACVNDYVPSTAKNSKLCGVQGVLIIYLTQTSALWCSLLIYKLHLLAVWRSNWIDNHYGWFTALCWILPLGFAIPVAVQGLAEYPGIGFSCIVSTHNLNKYLFYPTAVYMYPAMICHFITVGKMIQLAAMSSKLDTTLSHLSADARIRATSTMQAKRLLRGQWRPALMMGTVMALLTVFWLFYFIDAHRLASIDPETTGWFQQWLGCLLQNHIDGKSPDETQSICSKTIRIHLPSIPWFTAAEILLALDGIVIGGIFMTKADFWEDWRYLLSNVFTRGKTGSSSRGSSPDLARAPSYQKSMQSPVKNMTVSREIYQNSSKAELNVAPGSQWYDMDDLLDKEYDDSGNRVLQRSLSYGSRNGITTHGSPNPTSEPPQYSSKNNTGDLLYRTPVNVSTSSSHWSPSAHTMSNPGGSYTEEPTLPVPVLRTPKISSAEPIYLSSSIHSNVASSPATSPTKYSHGSSLSPMPPRSPTQQHAGQQRQQQQRSNPIESVPIIAVATRGTPSQAYRKNSQPSSPVSQKQRAEYYNSNESFDRMNIPSRQGGEGSSTVSSPNTSLRINTVAANAGATMDPRTMSPPPSLPYKNPHRQTQTQGQGQSHGGRMSPSVRSPTFPNNNNNYRG
ncbi:hypothetical protein BGZ76_004331 [Entomortierella beljakovae]|nr:hypothetical protein BGZ76_004331 [Entomortierella beljakovae]